MIREEVVEVGPGGVGYRFCSKWHSESLLEWYMPTMIPFAPGQPCLPLCDYVMQGAANCYWIHTGILFAWWATYSHVSLPLR